MLYAVYVSEFTSVPSTELYETVSVFSDAKSALTFASSAEGDWDVEDEEYISWGTNVLREIRSFESYDEIVDAYDGVIYGSIYDCR